MPVSGLASYHNFQATVCSRGGARTKNPPSHKLFSDRKGVIIDLNVDFSKVEFNTSYLPLSKVPRVWAHPSCGKGEFGTMKHVFAECFASGIFNRLIY
jgi:hypothetical protein